MQGDEQELPALAQLFISECPKMMLRIQDSIASGDAQQLQLAAHTLKGSAHFFDAQEVVNSAWELESMGRAALLHTAPQEYLILHAAVQRLLAALTNLAEAVQS